MSAIQEGGLSRRQFLQLAGAGASAAFLAACQPRSLGSETPSAPNPELPDHTVYPRQEWGMDKLSNSSYEAWYHDARCTTAEPMPDQLLPLIKDEWTQRYSIKTPFIATTSFFDDQHGFVSSDIGLNPWIIDQEKWLISDSDGNQPYLQAQAMVDAGQEKGSPLVAHDLTIRYTDIYGDPLRLPITFSQSPLPEETPPLSEEVQEFARQANKHGGLVYDIRTTRPDHIATDNRLAVVRETPHGAIVTDTAYMHAGNGLLRVGHILYEKQRSDYRVPLNSRIPDSVPEGMIEPFMKELIERRNTIASVTVYPVSFSQA